ncbi:tyrosine-type recombinase/integrase [Rhizobium leguminosarum bv. trifolii]|uniref:DUF6538 domain-containing protein n=1 Tax=Rhizobium leguminosarum TaxID=384 RepID=UPI00140FC9A8|nr:DUF6538 domain-containing protein [Rhizobium leguminosarum]QIO73935.1 tyrosine-type recombinase/integrase [Rhizobium leguminosarum bv. trifolii]QIO80954.1 tyrosine-type recombinase/integrase [Rhizobium leguminosarum bv. trifolii]
MEDMTIYPWLTLRNRTYYLRAPVPADLRDSLGKVEIWKSLRTQDRRTAIDRLRRESAEVTALFESQRQTQVKRLEPPLQELTEAQLKSVNDAYFVHLLEEDEETRESGFEGRDFDDDAEWLEALDADNRHEFARGKVSAFMFDEAAEVLSWDNIDLRLVEGSPSWPKVIREIYRARIKADEVRRLRNTGAVIDTPKAPPPLAKTVENKKPTLEDAKNFYITERVSGNVFAQKKRKTRLAAMMRQVGEALAGEIPPLPDWTIEHAYQVRDFMLSKEGIKPSTVRRDLNDLKGVFSLYRDKKLRSMDNPFAGLELPKSVVSDKAVRDALPGEVVSATRKLIFDKANPDLKAIWRLLEGTGCRLAEVTGLRVQDVVLHGEAPHIKVVAHKGRQLKNASSRRDVPLVDDALSAAHEAIRNAGTGEYAFPRYSGPTGPNTASQSLMKWLRKVTINPLHAVHSLRHNMADRCDLAGVHPTDKAAILGHLNPGATEKHYGSEAVKRIRLTRAMEKALRIDMPAEINQ